LGTFSTSTSASAAGFASPTDRVNSTHALRASFRSPRISRASQPSLETDQSRSTTEDPSVEIESEPRPFPREAIVEHEAESTTAPRRIPPAGIRAS